MQNLKEALEDLDESLTFLEEKIVKRRSLRTQEAKKNLELLKASKHRETQLLAVTQKVASRLDNTIEHVERALRD